MNGDGTIDPKITPAAWNYQWQSCKEQQTMGVIDYGATEAGVVVMMVPALILFLFLQRYYVRGFMSGAIKG